MSWEISFINSRGQHYTVSMKAVSAKQALWRYVQKVPGNRWLWGYWNRGDGRLQIKQEGGAVESNQKKPAPAYEQLALF